MKKSNCFFAALSIMSRTGGRILWTSPNWSNPFGHFMVITKDRVIDFVDDLTEEDEENFKWHWLFWYEGHVRRITRKHFDRWLKKQLKTTKR